MLDFVLVEVEEVEPKQVEGAVRFEEEERWKEPGLLQGEAQTGFAAADLKEGIQSATETARLEPGFRGMAT